MQSAPGVARGSVGSVSSCSSGNITHEEKYGSADGLELEEEDAHIPLSKHSRTSSTHSYASGLANVDSSQVHDYQPLSALATQASSYLSHSRVNKPDICVTHSAGLDGTDAKGVEHYPKNDNRKPVKHECEYGLESNEYSDADSNRGPGPVRSKKQRGARARERMRIELAPDQPPTTHGKQRERVYVACQQCRSRKIRCDGAKPMCFNCRQRGTGACNFDAVPRRRGPDRLPGARQRPSKRGAATSPQFSGPRISTMAVLSNQAMITPPSAVSTLYSPDASPSVPSAPHHTYVGAAPVFTNPFIAHEHISTNPIFAPSGPAHGLNRGSLDSLDTAESSASPDSVYVPEDVDRRVSQPFAHPSDPTLSAYITSTEIVEEEPSVSAPYVLSQTPSLDFVRKTWWDSLLDTYCAEPYSVGNARSLTAQIIVRDLRMLFKHSNHWFSFINIPLFFQTFFCARDTMQPALVLAILAFGVFLRSSNADLGEEGMVRTLWLKEKAQAALDASVAASWVDPGLAQAAWILSLFEFSTQPMRSVSRIHSALTTMDNIIRALALTLIDAEDPSTSASSNPTLASQGLRTSSSGYLAHVLPVPLYNHQPISDDRARPHHASLLLQYQDPHAASNPSPKCLCNELSLGRVWRETQEYTPFWMCTPAWNPAWGVAEIRREECRRLCWSTLTMLAGYTAYRASLGLSIIDLFILHPSNYRNVFPGENLTDLSVSSSTHTTPETVWALYARIMLLWHACLRIRNGNASDQERAIFAHSVWLETDAIENALNGHTCNTERTFLFQGREYLFNARMYVSHEFRRFVPHPNLVMLGSVHRRKAEEWLTHQATLSSRVMKGLQTVTGMPGNVLAKRPFFVFWFMGHISRCLQLWSADKSLIKALELSKDFLPPIDYLSALWPCEEQRTQYARIRQELENACHEAGLDPLPPLNLVFPPPSSPSALV
ncbi:hypothetical protein DFH11DRAFT_1510242 [Phellopilus nigrolimitatus]|nr:hypothetical protein DFH11DRAFT_1510242 [Phellopilus nigrolimitatus]